MRLHTVTALLLFFGLSTTAQHEILLSFDELGGGVDVHATIALEHPLSASYTFQLFPVSDVSAYRRQLRKREKVALNQSGNQWTLHTTAWKQQPHQALDLTYHSNLKALGGLVQAGSHIMLNPSKCSECKPINPFDVRNFRWNALIPSMVRTVNLSISMTRDGSWFSNAELVFSVEEEDRILLNFGQVALDDLYFYWRSDDGLLALGNQTKQEKRTNEKPLALQKGDEVDVKKTHIDSAALVYEEHPVADDIADASEVQQRSRVTVNLPQMPQLPSPLDARVNPTIWRFAVDTSQYVFIPITVRKDPTMAFSQQYDPPYFGLFRYVSRELYAQINATSSRDKRWRIAYNAYQNEYGHDEAQIRVLRGIEIGDLPSEVLGERAFGPRFDATVNHLTVRRNRSQDCLEVRQSKKDTLSVMLVFDDSVTQVDFQGESKVCLPTTLVPKTYVPLMPNSPVEFSLSDGQAFALLQMRGDALSRYWAMRSLLQSSSPYTCATAAAFGIDDPIEVIREMAFEASLTIPAFASERVEKGWEQIRNEGTYAQSLAASEQLREKRQSSVALPTNPCEGNIGWADTPMKQMCDWAQRYASQPKMVVSEVKKTMNDLDSSGDTYLQERLELMTFLDVLTSND